jgi:hypothetical protein
VRLLAACPAAVAWDAAVAYFGDPAKQVRRFADPRADGMSRASTAHAFLAAVEEAHASAVAVLCSSLTCACLPPPEAGVVVGLANLSPA